MSPSISSEENGRAWYNHALVRLFVTPFIVPIVFGAASVYISQARTAERIEAVEQSVVATDARLESNRVIREKKDDEIRRDMVTKELLDAKWKTVEEIKHTTDLLLKMQLEERRRR